MKVFNSNLLFAIHGIFAFQYSIAHESRDTGEECSASSILRDNDNLSCKPKLTKKCADRPSEVSKCKGNGKQSVEVLKKFLEEGSKTVRTYQSESNNGERSYYCCEVTLSLTTDEEDRAIYNLTDCTRSTYTYYEMDSGDFELWSAYDECYFKHFKTSFYDAGCGDNAIVQYDCRIDEDNEIDVFLIGAGDDDQQIDEKRVNDEFEKLNYGEKCKRV